MFKATCDRTTYLPCQIDPLHVPIVAGTYTTPALHLDVEDDGILRFLHQLDGGQPNI